MNWNLDEIFSSDCELDNFIDNLKLECKKFGDKYKDKLKEFNDFDEIIKEYENLCEKIAKIETFVSLKFSLNSSLGGFVSKYEMMVDEIYEEILFFELELNSNNLIDEAINSSKNYKYYLQNLKENKKHQLSLDEERILLKTSPVGAKAFIRLFDESISKFSFDFDDKKISLEELLSNFSDKNRDNRKKANKLLHDKLRDNKDILLFIFNMIKTDLKISKELRCYDYPECIMHRYNQISKNSVDALIDACESNFGISHTFYAKKAEILGYELYEFDRYAPILDENEEISYEEAKNIVLNAFKNFDEEFYKIALKAFDENWIDVYPKELKTSGAFSHPAIKELHPYILLNYTNKLRDVFTLAHELGHSIHQFLSYKQSYLNSHTPLTTSECASVFAEMLVFDEIIKSHKNKKALLANKLEDIFATAFRQINFTTFERRFHSFDDELSYEEISKIWLEESAKMFGNSLKLSDEYGNFWGYISHFIHSPFYCYSYAYAQLLVLSIFGIYKNRNCENFNEKYKQILSLAGSISPSDEMRVLGINIDDKNFWQIGLDEIKILLDKFLKE